MAGVASRALHLTEQLISRRSVTPELFKAAGVPIVPVAHNAGWYWRRRALIKYPGTIRVRIGPAIQPGELSAPELTEAARNWIEGAVAELDEVARAEVGAALESADIRGENAR